MSDHEPMNGGERNFFRDALDVIKEDIKENVKPDIRNLKEDTKILKDQVQALNNYFKIAIGLLIICGVGGGIGGTVLSLAITGYKKNVSEVFDTKASEVTANFEKKASDAIADFRKTASDGTATFQSYSSATVRDGLFKDLKIVPSRGGAVRGNQGTFEATCPNDENKHYKLIGGTCDKASGKEPHYLQNFGIRPERTNVFGCTYYPPGSSPGEDYTVEIYAFCLALK
ncbi:hypothetical protein AWB67_06483 [Caballeronia terrestris]|uniref:Uncharacterized protein n=1 Tax=Caballeronia terrestris TaxID=1226301 RepID=A0A158KSY4_9BURK|nr:hypothetical protein [Caballeronia terrestris]SAL83710.1 hypothetical protein AWB67_06483 [Caballeronia terrestris]